MNEYSLQSNTLTSESDVEQKVVYPLLTNPEPVGFGFDSSEIQTKHHLSRFTLDKGRKKEVSYIPDYVVNLHGLPALVIEAKKPGENLVEALREAALYATALNRLFPANLNPCRLVMACDGLQLIAGKWDTAEAAFDIAVEDWNPENSGFHSLCTEFAKSNVEPLVREYRSLIRPTQKYSKPLQLIGSSVVQNRNTSNEFGDKISIQYQHLFNPNEEAEKIDVVQNAYVEVKSQESRINPIDKLIRKKFFALEESTVEIEDTGSPDLIIRRLEEAHRYNNHVLLLVGSVGSGKSTFATYLRKVALDQTLVAKLVWLTFDLNDAPVSKEEIYRWIKNNIVRQLKDRLSETSNTDNLDFLMQLFEKPLEKELAGPLSLFTPGSDEHNKHLYETLTRFREDLDLVVGCYIYRAVHAVGKELIIVLDNCDKRTLEDQMLMFEVANWIKDTMRTIVFLPLRDTTFDHFRHEKPLDTVVKDLTFRISAPPLYQVLNERLQYAARLSEKEGESTYLLPNGMRVQIPARDEQAYFRCILSSLFHGNKFRRLLLGLTGGNVREGLEIFLDFCKSGHISADLIFKMRQSNGEYILPEHIISRVFLRRDRLYYTDPNARIKNLFQSDPGDELPDPFIRVLILQWLYRKRKERGPSGIAGFHKAEELVSNLIALGHEGRRVSSELLQLLRFSLVVNESQNSNVIADNELIAITSSGIVHLDIVENLEYLATVAEDVWFVDSASAQEIANTMVGKSAIGPNTVSATIRHAEILNRFLSNYFDTYFHAFSKIVDKNSFWIPLDFDRVTEQIEDLRLAKGRIFKVFAEDSIHRGRIKKELSIGFLVDIDDSGQWGFLPAKEYTPQPGTRAVNTVIDIKIKERDEEAKRYKLSLP